MTTDEIYAHMLCLLLADEHEHLDAIRDAADLMSQACDWYAERTDEGRAKTRELTAKAKMILEGQQ